MMAFSNCSCKDLLNSVLGFPTAITALSLAVFFDQYGKGNMYVDKPCYFVYGIHGRRMTLNLGRL